MPILMTAQELMMKMVEKLWLVTGKQIRAPMRSSCVICARNLRVPWAVQGDCLLHLPHLLRLLPRETVPARPVQHHRSLCKLLSLLELQLLKRLVSRLAMVRQEKLQAVRRGEHSTQSPSHGATFSTLLGVRTRVPGRFSVDGTQRWAVRLAQSPAPFPQRLSQPKYFVA